MNLDRYTLIDPSARCARIPHSTWAVDWAGWATFGFVATVLLTGIMVGSQLLGLSRMDLPLMLGTIFVESPDRARIVGFSSTLPTGRATTDCKRPCPEIPGLRVPTDFPQAVQ
jgi:hypothetical protein